jgi:hypothetical protein
MMMVEAELWVIMQGRLRNFVLGQNNEQASLQAKRSKQKEVGATGFKKS